MSKRERLAYARSKGWVYDPPAYFGTNVKTTHHIQKEQMVREDGKIVATLKQPGQTYEQRVEKETQTRQQKQYGKQTAETLRQFRSGELKTDADIYIYDGKIVVGKKGVEALQAEERERRIGYAQYQVRKNIEKKTGIKNIPTDLKSQERFNLHCPPPL